MQSGIPIPWYPLPISRSPGICSHPGFNRLHPLRVAHVILRHGARPAGIGEFGGGLAEVENLVEVASEGGQIVARLFLPSHKCKPAGNTPRSLLASSI